MKMKSIILMILIFIFILILFVENFFGVKYTDRIPILTFHKLISDEVKRKKFINNQWVGSIDVFDQMMDWLYVNNYKTISTKEFYQWYKGYTEYPPNTVLITFDDGNYDFYYLAFPILKKYNFKATVFIVGNRTEKKTPKYNENKLGYIGEDIIEKLKEIYPNIEFQSHSFNFHSKRNDKPLIDYMSFQAIKSDILANSKFNCTTMAYPYGKYNKNIKRILDEQGYLCAFAFGPYGYATRNSDKYAIPRIKIGGFSNINDMINWVKY